MIATQRLIPLYKVSRVSGTKEHFYQIENEDRWLPGATSPLGVLDKKAILPWALNSMGENIKGVLKAREVKPFSDDEIDLIIKEGKNIYKKKAKDAADLGTRVHFAINELIHGRNPEITPDIKSGVDGFLAWKDSNKLTIELGDTCIASKIYGYGGSLDFVAFDGNEAIIFDNKTTKKRKDRDHGIYPEAAYQLAAYQNAFRETYGIPVKAVYGLWLCKETGAFRSVKVNNVSAAFETFLACLKIYQMQKYELFDDERKI